MANIKSAQKRVRVSEFKTMKNRMAKTSLKTTLKSFEAARVAGDTNITELYRATVKKVDQAAAAGILHANTAARRKSALARSMNQKAEA